MDVPIRISPPKTTPGGRVTFTAELPEADDLRYEWEVRASWPGGDTVKLSDKGRRASWETSTTAGVYAVDVKARKTEGRRLGPVVGEGREEFEVVGQRISFADAPLTVNLQRSDIPDTEDQALWSAIRHGTDQLSFSRYAETMDAMFCADSSLTPLARRFSDAGLVFSSAASPFADMYSYKLLKVATEAFIMANCGVSVDDVVVDEEEADRLGLQPGTTIQGLMERYLEPVAVGDDGATIEVLPYLALVRKKLPEVPIRVREGRLDGNGDGDGVGRLPVWELCYRILQRKLTAPCLIELIWSYWHEEGGLVQTLNAISMRFQNRRGPGERDPLAHVAIDPLRPLNNLLWGYIQDEQHRLSLPRRAYEYLHHYGLPLVGRAVPPLRSADSRSRFLEAFHDLLTRAAAFYREEDDTTTIADAFPVLNALREVHLLLGEGADNQYGDLPWTARHEMLMQQWLLARPEFREFLPTRVMVVYPEPWMDRVDAMKRLQGWTDVSIRHFHDLAVYGEQILLSIRFGNWSDVIDRAQAANWARYWRQEVQWYIHSYAAVTGVDLSADVADVRPAAERALAPAVHLQRRQTQRRPELAAAGAPAPMPVPVGTRATT